MYSSNNTRSFKVLYGDKEIHKKKKLQNFKTAKTERTKKLLKNFTLKGNKNISTD